MGVVDCGVMGLSSGGNYGADQYGETGIRYLAEFIRSINIAILNGCG